MNTYSSEAKSFSELINRNVQQPLILIALISI